jgi:cytochrome c-type biogenesis protein CcmE
MDSKVKLIVGGIGVLVLFSVLAVTTMGGAAEFVSPTDLEEESGYEGSRVNLEGIVTGLEQRDGRIHFDVTDANASVPASYDGPMPETMADGRTVVAKGYFDGSSVEADDLSVRAHEGERPGESHPGNSSEYPENGTEYPEDGSF